MTTPLDNLLDFDQSALKAYCERVGEKSFRATQLFRWIHHRGVGNFDDMTDLARSLRTKLAGVAEVRPLAVMTERLHHFDPIDIVHRSVLDFPVRASL